MRRMAITVEQTQRSAKPSGERQSRGKGSRYVPVVSGFSRTRGGKATTENTEDTENVESGVFDSTSHEAVKRQSLG